MKKMEKSKTKYFSFCTQERAHTPSKTIIIINEWKKNVSQKKGRLGKNLIKSNYLFEFMYE